MSNDANNQQEVADRRLAIILDVNKYHADVEIPKLAGAENYAQKICETHNNCGQF